MLVAEGLSPAATVASARFAFILKFTKQFSKVLGCDLKCVATCDSCRVVIRNIGSFTYCTVHGGRYIRGEIGISPNNQLFLRGPTIFR
jgi:hypothetical protein